MVFIGAIDKNSRAALLKMCAIVREALAKN